MPTDAIRRFFRALVFMSGKELLAILKADFQTGPAAAFHEFLKSGKRGFVQERRISRRATLKIVDPADDEIELGGRRKRDAA